MRVAFVVQIELVESLHIRLKTRKSTGVQPLFVPFVLAVTIRSRLLKQDLQFELHLRKEGAVEFA